MCLSTLPPGVVRMRHWSCPERLTSDLSPPLTEDPLLSIKKSKEAEDSPAPEESAGLRLRVLAPWEERVLVLRELRRSKRRQDAEASEDFEDCAADINNQDCEEISSTRHSDLTTSETSIVGPSSEDLGNLENIGQKTEELDLKCDEKYPELSPMDSKSRRSRARSLSREETDENFENLEFDLTAVGKHFPEFKSPKKKVTTNNANLAEKSFYNSTSCHSYTRCSYVFNYLAILLLPILIKICSVHWPSLSRQPRERSRFAHWTSLSSLGFLGLCLVLVCPVTSVTVETAPTTDSVCPDGIYRGNININNKGEDTKMSSLEKYKDCRVVEGSISITSAIYPMEKNATNISLPNLVEVTDFVLLYRADEIRSLETLFPKLSVIRGHKLVVFYALAIYQMKNMENVGLPSLTHIMNGGVRIEKNPRLCYVNTVNWKNIVVQENDKKSHIEIVDNQESNKCLDSCPSHCSGGCWSPSRCQVMTGPCEDRPNLTCYSSQKGQSTACSSQCVGGCGDSEENCVSCNHTRLLLEGATDFTCTAKCPPKYVAYENWMCINETECSDKKIHGFMALPTFDMAKSVYKVHKDQCVDNCPNLFEPLNEDGIWRCVECRGNCTVQCDGENINSPESAKRLQSCTHINGDLVINVNRGDITSVLEESLADIQEISGSLKIERSHSLVSLHFFKSLKKIGSGQSHSQKTLNIFENDNLQKLFPDDKVIELGEKKSVFIHFNQKLCLKEITKFLDLAKVNEINRKENFVSTVSNGNKIVCSEEKLNLKVIPGGPHNLRLQYKNYLQTLEMMGTEDVTSLLGYHIFYRELTEEQFARRDITKYEGMDACGTSAWDYMFEDDPARFSHAEETSGDASCDKSKEKCIIMQGKLVAKYIYTDAIAYIPNCKPYTPYAIYVTTVMEKKLAGKATGAQSDIVYARTNETNPSPVGNLKAESPDPNSLKISWDPPVKPHGIIDRYYVEVSYLGTGKDIEDRNYCEKKKQVTPEKSQQPPQSPLPTEDELGGSCPVCQACDGEAESRPSAPDPVTVLGEKSFYDDIINKIFPLTQPSAISEQEDMGFAIYSRKKRAVSSSGLRVNSITAASNQTFVYIKSQMKEGIKSLAANNVTMVVGGRTYSKRELVNLPGNMTSVTVNNLKHFTDYEIRVYACQKEKISKDKTFRACSDEAILNTKTTFDRNADRIIPWNNAEDLFTHSGNGSEGIIKWFPPPNPNERIVNYKLSRSPDAQPETDFIKCISLTEITETFERIDGEERRVLQYKLTTDGEYYIRLQAVSLFDEGSWTKFQFVRVNSNGSNMILTLFLVFFAFLIMGMGAFGGYTYYKKKKAPTWTLSSSNPEYIDTSEVYVVDNWEVAREHIEKDEEPLGKGSFGLVFRGVYNHPTKGQIPCAIKTVNEKSSYRQRIEFLHEASVMKDYNTEHVIKLIGVVSQGQPALVLMELMENGDLKNYLRSLRPDSENNKLGLPVPTLRQVLQMAIEISDGMSYLSVKKIVHRDLAARNCMVSNDVVVKVGDFGMARDIYETEYYRKEGRGLLPVRWMAPESIKDGKFTSQSDVWSFGVVLWEMATLAEQPYQGFTNDQVMKYVKEGNKMKRPDDCPDILFELMSECWHIIPDERPTFLQICQRLLGESNERFRQTSFFHTPEGREAVINQEEMLQSRREQEEARGQDPATPLTLGQNGNGQHASHESHQLVSMRQGARSPTQVHFSNESGSSFRPSKLSMNGIVQRLRNKSGSTSGEA